jgi:hypothetical protein
MIVSRLLSRYFYETVLTTVMETYIRGLDTCQEESWMQSFIKIFAYTYGAVLSLGALLSTAAYALDGKTGWAIAWGLVLCLTVYAVLWVRRVINKV